MKGTVRLLVVGIGLSVGWLAPSWSGQPPAGKSPGQDEWEAPVAKVPMAVEGDVVAVDAAAKTFTVATLPRRRLPPGKVLVAINRDTKMVRHEMLPAEAVKVGDTLVVQAQRPGGVGLPVFAQGEVVGLAPLIVAVSEKVKLVVGPGAEVSFMRLSELRLEDMSAGMKVQVVAWRGDQPVVAREVNTFVVFSEAKQMPRRAEEGAEAKPEGTGEAPSQ